MATEQQQIVDQPTSAQAPDVMEQMLKPPVAGSAAQDGTKAADGAAVESVAAAPGDGSLGLGSLR